MHLSEINKNTEMKKLTKLVLFSLLILFNMNKIQSQTSETKLEQVELMKQFLGVWKAEFGDGSVFTSENKQFGNGMSSNSQIINNNGEVIESVIQLFGYDKKTDKFIIAELKTSSPVIEICSIWFTSKQKGEIVITNPSNAPFSFKFEFKSSDTILQSAIKDNQIVNKVVLSRVVRDNDRNEFIKENK